MAQLRMDGNLMANFISPQQVYDEPHRWLGVPHETHVSLGELMELMFPDFRDKISGVHCLECEGEVPFIVFEKNGGAKKLCTGYVDDPETRMYLVEVP